jgi:hypothetical protein
VPPEQATPHPPQFALSVDSSTQELPHAARPVPQTSVHAPEEHC